MRKQRLGRAVQSFVQTKIPYAFPLPRLPYVLVVEPTTHCNLHCIMCPSPGFQSPRGYMSMDVYEKVLREAVAGSMHRIRFIGLGEPLLHPQLPEMIRLAKQGGLYTEVSTNATLLTREYGPRSHRRGARRDWLLAGFGRSAAASKRIRKGAKYHEVIANIDGFLELCAADRRRAPITVARMVMMNESKIEEFSRRWSGKVDSLQFNALRVYAHTGIASKVRRALTIPPPPTQLKRKVRCRQILHKMQVSWDGSVGLCNQSSVLIGDAKTSSLEEIWRGYVLQKVRSAARGVSRAPGGRLPDSSGDGAGVCLRRGRVTRGRRDEARSVAGRAGRRRSLGPAPDPPGQAR